MYKKYFTNLSDRSESLRHNLGRASIWLLIVNVIFSACIIVFELDSPILSKLLATLWMLLTSLVIVVLELNIFKFKEKYAAGFAAIAILLIPLLTLFGLAFIWEIIGDSCENYPLCIVRLEYGTPVVQDSGSSSFHIDTLTSPISMHYTILGHIFLLLSILTTFFVVASNIFNIAEIGKGAILRPLKQTAFIAFLVNISTSYCILLINKNIFDLLFYHGEIEPVMRICAIAGMVWPFTAFVATAISRHAYRDYLKGVLSTNSSNNQIHQPTNPPLAQNPTDRRSVGSVHDEIYPTTDPKPSPESSESPEPSESSEPPANLA